MAAVSTIQQQIPSSAPLRPILIMECHDSREQRSPRTQGRRVRFDSQLNWNEEEIRAHRGQAMRKKMRQRLLVERGIRCQQHRDRKLAFDVFHSQDPWTMSQVQEMLREDAESSLLSSPPDTNNSDGTAPSCLYTKGLEAMLRSLGAPSILDNNMPAMLEWFRSHPIRYTKHLRCHHEFVDTYLLYLGRAEIFQKRFVDSPPSANHSPTSGTTCQHQNHPPSTADATENAIDAAWITTESSSSSAPFPDLSTAESSIPSGTRTSMDEESNQATIVSSYHNFGDHTLRPNNELLLLPVPVEDDDEDAATIFVHAFGAGQHKRSRLHRRFLFVTNKYILRRAFQFVWWSLTRRRRRMQKRQKTASSRSEGASSRTSRTEIWWESSEDHEEEGMDTSTSTSTNHFSDWDFDRYSCHHATPTGTPPCSSQQQEMLSLAPLVFSGTFA